MNLLVQAGLFIVSLCLVVSCGSEESNPSSNEPEGEIPSFDGEVALSSMSDGADLLSSISDTGECGVKCQSSLVIDAEGNITYTKFDSLEIQDTTNVDTLRDIISSTKQEDLITGENDCGRQVDGVASVLTVAGTEIDLCYVTVNTDHQLMVYLKDLRKALNSDVPDLKNLEDTESWNPLGYKQKSDVPELDPVPTMIDPAECPEGSKRSTYDFGSSWILIRQSGEGFCDVWFGGEEENPNYDGSPHQYCHLPIQHKPVAIEGAGEASAGFINSLWCQDRSE